jgi:hypothetical protein
VSESCSLHDTLGDQPLSHLALVPFGVSSVLGVIVVVLHQREELVPSGRFGVDDTVSDKPFMKVRGGPSVVDRVGCFRVCDLDVVEESSSASRSRGGNNIVLLEPSPELVVVP